MKKSEFREFVKEMFIDLIHHDDEVKDIVLEFVQENTNILSESKKASVPKEPADPELYDQLVLVASGQKEKFLYEGKSVTSPNYGVGFKSGKQIKEWANKAYSKVGGKWDAIVDNSSSAENVAALAEMFGGTDGGSQGARLLGVASTGNERALQEAIRLAVPTQALDENLEPTGMDMTSILADTARTTLKNFPASHGGAGAGGALSASAGVKEQESFSGTPEQAFGTKAVGNWASLAFSGMDV